MKTVTPEEKEAMISRARWYKRFFLSQKIGKILTVIIIALALPYPLGVLWRLISMLFDAGYNLLK